MMWSKAPAFAACVAAAALILSGCSSSNTSSSETPSSDGTASSTHHHHHSHPANESRFQSLIDDHDTVHFEQSDLSIEAVRAKAIKLLDDSAESEAKGVDIDGSTVTITQGGKYRISGSLTGQLIVDAGHQPVTLLFEGVTISSTSGSPVMIKSAKKVTLLLAEGMRNTLSDVATSGENSDDDDAAATVEATLLARADLTIAGEGALDIVGNTNDAIKGSHGVVIAGGTISLTAAHDAIAAKNYVDIVGGSLTIDAGHDAIRATSDHDGRGFVTISNGKIVAKAGHKGLVAENDLTISNGSVTVTKSEEGFEAEAIAIVGGKIEVTSTDDGINVSGDDPQWFDMTGGDVTITSGGDGFDSNGSAHLGGGTLIVYGPPGDDNGAIDTDLGFTVTGGNLWAIGGANMAQTPGQGTTQTYVSAIMHEQGRHGATEILIEDESGNVVGSIARQRPFESVVFSAPGLSKTAKYRVRVNGTIVVNNVPANKPHKAANQ